MKTTPALPAWKKKLFSHHLLFLSSGLIIGWLIMINPISSAAVDRASNPSSRSAPAALEIKGFGILGDSGSDEYQTDDHRGGKYASTTLNWMELLAAKRGLNFGPWGDWGEPRRTGYKYNWARSVATTASLLSSGQHLGLAEQVANGEVSHVFVWIGANDFSLENGLYRPIYNGDLSDAEVQARVDQIVANITTAVDTVRQAGEVEMVIALIPALGTENLNLSNIFNNPAKHRRVTSAINRVNMGIQTMAAERGIAVANTDEIGAALLGRIDKLGFLRVGWARINVFTPGDEPHHGLISGPGAHAGTVLSGVIANEIFIKSFNRAYGLGLQPFSDEELLQNAGLSGPNLLDRLDLLSSVILAVSGITLCLLAYFLYRRYKRTL